MQHTQQLQREMRLAAKSAKPLCAGYWAGFSSEKTNNEHDPIKMASFYKGIGN